MEQRRANISSISIQQLNLGVIKCVNLCVGFGETSANCPQYRSMDPRGSYLLFRGILWNCDTTRVRDQLTNGRNKERLL